MTKPLEQENKAFKRILGASVLTHVIAALVLLFAPPAEKPVERVEIDLQQMPELEGGGGGGGGGGTPTPQVKQQAATAAPAAAEPTKTAAEPAEEIPAEMSYSQRRLAAKAAEPVPTESSYSQRRKASNGSPGSGSGSGTGSGQGSGTGTGVGSGSGSGNGDGDGDSFGPFRQKFWSKMKPIWQQEMDKKANGLAGKIEVKIVFNRSGQVVNVKILRGSGDQMVDAAFVNALSLLPPIQGFPSGKSQFVLVGTFEQFQQNARAL